VTQASIVDVAARAGVSVATVSRALRDHPHVADATRKRVHDAARALQYVADTNASRLASGRSNTIGLLAPILTSWYTSEVIAGVEEVLQDAELDLLISTRPGSPDARRVFGPDGAFRQRVDGMILVDMFVGSAGADELLKAAAPAVVLGESLHQLTSLSIDNRLGAEMATRHLLELGHRRIALIGGVITPGSQSNVPPDRTAGYHAALAAQKIRRERALQVDGMFTIEGGRRAARQLLQSAQPPTAIFCMSDEMAFGVMQTARELGLSVPGDLSLMGFDDHPASEAFGLSTIRQPVREMGRMGARLMIDIVAGHGTSATHHPLGIALISRMSTGPVS
jgi:DNA-binding LacI/PurR family transcriptional regulator